MDCDSLRGLGADTPSHQRGTSAVCSQGISGMQPAPACSLLALDKTT